MNDALDGTMGWHGMAWHVRGMMDEGGGEGPRIISDTIGLFRHDRMWVIIGI
jgi:hypothetical protein